MDENGILKQLSKPVGKKEVLELANVFNNARGDISLLINLCFHQSPQIAFRAAWLLEHVQNGDPVRFSQNIESFINAYIRQNKQSCRRHYSNILVDQFRLQQNRSVIDKNSDNLTETTFIWLTDMQTPVAVKVNCMDVLFLLIPYNHWIKDELAEQITFLKKNGSAAVQSRGRKFLARLAEIKT